MRKKNRGIMLKRKGGNAEAASSEQNQESDTKDDSIDLSKEDLVKLVTEKEALLETKQKEIAAIQDKVLSSYAEMENVMKRARREAENSKKFAIQNFYRL